ncbi:MAG: hypothetical protein Q7S66_02835 [bacterium]|nr:hypothetical protein [bacterium]
MPEQKAWVVTVDMGYGHQRAAYPLRDLSPTGKVIIANNYQGIPKHDHLVWKVSRKIYEAFSRTISIPLIGRQIFNFMDYFQKIQNFYPRRDLSKPTLQTKSQYSSIRAGWGRDLIDKLNQEDIPLIATFFTIAFMAEEHEFKNDIYLVVTDTDISRVWAPLNPHQSRIKYLAPCRRVVERLKLYGVKPTNIFLSGFPLPEENMGDGHLRLLKGDLVKRISNLDPDGWYMRKYGGTMKQFLKDRTNTNHKDRPLTLTFAVGGAGAQRKLAHAILLSLKAKILKQEIIFNLVSGTRSDVYRYFHEQITDHGMSKMLGKSVNIISGTNKEDYFDNFNIVLRDTDILWTKPSELVFYSALGLPIIMAPTVGSQEDYNKYWLTKIGGGIDQEDPHLTHEWLFDWVNSGWLAEAAMAGFLDGRQFGVENIKKIVFEGIKEPAKTYQLL